MTNLHALTFYDLPSKREKSEQSAKIASDIAKFEARGGKIQVLGDTEFTDKTKPLREVFRGTAEERAAAKKEKRG